jgi:hypothetical protein
MNTPPNNQLVAMSQKPCRTRLAFYAAFFTFSVLYSPTSMACRGASAEIAQESQATVLFIGKLQEYERDPAPSPREEQRFAMLTFEVLETIRGDHRTAWKAVMRGKSLPHDKEEFERRFGTTFKTGLYGFDDRNWQPFMPVNFRGKPFVVNAWCSMVRDDWLIHPVDSR